MTPLYRHPDTPPGRIHTVEAELVRTRRGAEATFLLSGPSEALRLPPAAPPVQTDGLWRTTCCELFVGESGGEAYREYNFSPSGAFAAYRFDGYREGMRPVEASVRIALEVHLRLVRLVATLDAPIPPLARVGLTVVVDEIDGGCRYWACQFAPGKADFHASAVRSLILDEVDAS